jgi:hypothetical protein
MYKTFIFKPQKRAFAKVDKPLQSDPQFENLLNNFSQLGWEYVEAISTNLGFLFAKEYLIVLKGEEGLVFDSLAEKVLKEEQDKQTKPEHS